MKNDYLMITLEVVALIGFSFIIYYFLYVFNKNKIRTKGTNYLVYHDNCLDGFMAALVAYEEAKQRGITKLVMVPANYSDEPVDAIAGDTITMVDFSYRSEVIREFISNSVTITVIDHHEKAIDDIVDNTTFRTNFANGIFTSLLFKNQPHLNLKVADNRNRECCHKEAGCALSYNTTTFDIRHLLGIEMTEYISTANRHDLWLHDGDHEDAASYLSSWFKQWSKSKAKMRDFMKKYPFFSSLAFGVLVRDFNKTSFKEKIEAGKIVVEENVQQAKRICATATPVTFIDGLAPKNIKVGFIDSEESFNVSMVGSLLVKEFDYDVSIMKIKTTDKGIVYSMRSNQNGSNVDVATICDTLFKKNIAVSGGGHRNAAGAVVPKDKNFFK